MDGSEAMVTVPTGSCRSARMSCSSERARSSSSLTCGNRRKPVSESSTPRPVRVKRRAPHSRSRALIWRLRKDWLLSRNSAARVRLPSSPMATKDRHFCKSAVMSRRKSEALARYISGDYS